MLNVVAERPRTLSCNPTALTHNGSNLGFTNVHYSFFSFICHFSCQFKKCIRMHNLIKIIWCDSRVMSIFTKIPSAAKMMLSKAFVTILHTSCNAEINQYAKSDGKT